MIGREFRFHDGARGAALAVRIVTGADKNELRKVLKDGTVVVHLKGKPKNQNLELISYLSSEMEISTNRFDIIAGDDGNDKLLSITNIEPIQIQNTILEKIP